MMILRNCISVVVAVLLALAHTGDATAEDYSLVLENGRVMDPESGLDAVRNVAILDGRIAAISASKLAGK